MTHHPEPEVFYGAQYLLPHTVLHRFDSGRREAPVSDALWGQRITADMWSKSFTLDQVLMGDALVIDIESDTFTPAEVYEGSTDERALSVA